MKLEPAFMKTSTVKDISHSETHTSPVALAEQKFERMISEVEDYALVLLDLSGTIVSWNRGAEKIKGYAAGEIIGKSFKLFYAKEEVEAVRLVTLRKPASKQGKEALEGWRVKKNGYRFWGNVTITALHDLSGELTGFLKVTKDLTDKKIAEDRYNNTL